MITTLQTLINEIETEQDYHHACMLMRSRIQAGMAVDSGEILSLAAKGHVIQPSRVSQDFVATLRAEPRG